MQTVLLIVGEPLLHQQTNEILRFIADAAENPLQDQARGFEINVFKLVYLHFLDCVHQTTLLSQLAQLLNMFDVDHVDAIGRTNSQQDAQVKQIILLQLLYRLFDLQLLELVGAGLVDLGP